MVSTQNYLCPDLLPPSSADPSKNPLQLLAQTCNNIGLPDQPSKSSKNNIISLDKLSDNKSHLKSEGTSSSSKSSHHKTTVSTLSTSTRSADSSHSHRSSDRKHSVAESSDKDARSSTDRSDGRIASSGNTETTGASTNQRLQVDDGKAVKKESDSSRCSSTPKESNKTTISQTFPPTLPTGSMPPKCSPCLPCPASGSSQTLPFFPHFPQAASFPMGPAGLSPSSMYASLHGAAAAGTLNPFLATACRDPFCKSPSCPTAMAAAAAFAATANGTGMPPRCPFPGCAQCTMSNTDWWWLYPYLSTAASVGLPTGFTGTSPPGGLGSSHFAALYAAAASANNNNNSSAGDASSVRVCSWISPEGYCGKRFTNAEELYQHVRMAHTSQESSAARSPGSTNNLGPAVTPGALGSYPPPAHLTGGNNLNGRISPRAFQSSLALLSLNRYHPYAGVGGTKPSAGGVNFGPFGHMPPFPGGFPAPSAHSLNALYGQRIPSSLSHP